MRLEEAPPPAPRAGQVVVAVAAVGVNPVDTYIRAGAYPPDPSTPFTPGSDAAGTVSVVGEGVTRASVGDRVYVAGSLSGTYAEQTLCREEDVHLLPPNVTFSQGAAIGVPYATAYHALFNRAHAEHGQTVLVHGASGGVGLAAVQLGYDGGLTMIGSAGSAEGRRLVAEQGAAHVVDHADPAHLEQVLALTDGRGVDVILEMAAHLNLGHDLSLLAAGGRVVVVGSRGTVLVNPRDLMNREADVVGMRLPNVRPDVLRAIHAALGAGLAYGTLRPIVAKELPLAAAPQAHREVLESPHAGKIVLVP